MRDIIITVMVFGMLPFILRNAWIGVLVWSWLSYMNPHRLAWGFAYTFPYAQIVAIVLLVALISSPERKTLPGNKLVFMWVLFLAWNIFCTFFAFYPEFAVEQLETVLKIQLVTFVTLMLMTSFERVNQLIWVIVFSIGFYSVKGGAFTLMTGGNFHVFGPDGSYIMENNTLAVAVLMIIPMMMYLYRFPPKPWVKQIMPICIFLSLASVIGSQSRGAVLAIAAVGGFFWLKSSAKAITAIIFVALAIFALLFMPDTYIDRVQSIADYQEDSSAMERLKAWEFSINMANDRLTGGGFNSWSMENYHKYAPGAKQAFVAHSIYFGVLGDSGWPGLLIFLAILFTIYRQLVKIIKATDNNPERADFNYLARMLQISMIAFMAGGAFLSLSYFDLAWHIMAITIAMTQLLKSVAPTEAPPLHPGKRMPPRVAGYGGYGRGRGLPGQ
ncbi:MAG: putative O-glycosylation ligase, exosortase A system-associated [Halioglobus sp.]|nr:putative O-glycosylation ligase, exosortase A system-associated [Halioglobus sp.]